MYPEAPVSKSSAKMEELALMALLECPLCLQQLDVTAKVLPCQHTFCMSCLQRQGTGLNQLLCPQCRAPVPTRTVDDLPENLLLVRLLEGLHVPSGPGRNTHTARYAVPTKGHHQQVHSEVTLRSSLYNHGNDPSAETVLTPANVTTSQHRVDDNPQYEDVVDSGSASVTTPQAVSQKPQLQPFQQPQTAALCRALRNFNPEDSNVEDSKYCLSFLKGDILAVIRRVDEHWIEAKLGEKVGICPLQFTEPNSIAAKLLKGKSRRESDSAEFHPQTGNGGKEKATDASIRTAHYGVPQVQAKTPIIHALPLSNQWKQPTVSSSGNLHQAMTGETSNIKLVNRFTRQNQSQRLSAPHAARGHSHPTRSNSQRIRRHSDSHRHLLQNTKKMTHEAPPTISMALMNPQMPSSSADSKASSTQQLSISVCAVLYSYKPRRPEELELRKGEMVGVYGKFKEGWLRGLSLKTGKVGILPGNYVTPVLRTSARLLETKAAIANASSQHNAITAKKPTGHVQSVPNGSQHATLSAGAGKPSLYGGSQGWETVRRLFNPQRGSNRFSYTNHNAPSNSQQFAQVQASGYSPALQRRKHMSILSKASRPLGWMTEPAAPSTARIMKDRDFTASHDAMLQSANGPQSILVKPDTHKNASDKPAKSVRFLTEEDSPPPRHRTSSWSGGNQVLHSGPPNLEVWAPSLTLGRDGPGIVLREGKGPVIRKGLETAISDLPTNVQNPASSLSALSAQFSPSRHRVMTTHLAQTDSELSLLQGEFVLVHRPRPDGRILVTQENSGQTGLFYSSVLQALERLS
ncbi:E3 ubiquitin-protein ligase SH3RF1 [Gouania willdenowi]|uniref:E3 ubiquitin-protein ligase SH3RF1-like n=1 Tax=Gouania willdenowi TaxID=441366 RepID=A0A8C5HBC1_GOUWI|nr:E3 ubiquitin-protein ligase SH3RF1-like [Gouania willdenowi]